MARRDEAPHPNDDLLGRGQLVDELVQERGYRLGVRFDRRADLDRHARRVARFDVEVAGRKKHVTETRA